MNAPRLQVNGLWHRFGLTDVIVDLHFSLQAGESVALIGPSGCGKSTLMQLLLGLQQPTHGHIINGFTRIGSMFQQPRLLPWMAVLDNIALGLRAQSIPKAARHQVAAGLAARVALSVLDHAKYPHELSGGMQSRVALARALAIEPDLLMLDEAFSSLDIGLRAEMYRLIQEYVQHKHCALLFITHDVMEAVRLADRVVMMAAPGQIVHETQYALPQTQRDEAWIYQNAGALMAEPAVRRGFELGAEL